MRVVLSTSDAPRSPSFSQGVRVGAHIHVSGTTGLDVTKGRLAGPTIREQTRQALENCRAVLRAGGADLADVVEVGVLLSEPEHFPGMNEEFTAWFPTDPPTRYVAKLGAVIPGVLVSIRMTAILG